MLKQPVSEFDIKMQAELNDQTLVHSRYAFLKAHNGLRPNSLHGIMSSTSAGKSTLMKCIITETAANNKVLVWLSEETVSEYQGLINFIDKSALSNITFVEEKEIPAEYKERQSDFFEYFEQMVEESGAKWVFIDNVTTSAFYNQRYGINGQNHSAEFLRGFVKKACSIIYAAHTRSDITENYSKVIASEDIRGSKELPMMTEYLYIIQKFTSNDKQYNVLRNAKYRHHEAASGWFALVYKQKAYIGDQSIKFSLVNQIFKTRDFLGRAIAKKKS